MSMESPPSTPEIENTDTSMERDPLAERGRIERFRSWANRELTAIDPRLPEALHDGVKTTVAHGLAGAMLSMIGLPEVGVVMEGQALEKGLLTFKKKMAEGAGEKAEADVNDKLAA